MLNLLFVSNSPKTEFLINVLQPRLKVKIDAVADFDHGLKDIFEKRPAIVIIQDQIADVTGESVARHIQMLLGKGAPSFIVIHEGNAQIKPIKGLYEHLIDLTQPDAKLAEDILLMLESIIGAEWYKITKNPKPGPDVTSDSIAATENDPTDAYSLVDELLSDFESVHKTEQEEDVKQLFSLDSKTDELARLLVETASEDKQHEEFPGIIQSNQYEEFMEISRQQPEDHELSEKTPESSPQESFSVTAPPDIIPVTSALDQEHADTKLSEPRNKDFSTPGIHSEITPAIAVKKGGDTPSSTKAIESNNPPSSPADFKISASSVKAQEKIPEDLLLAFEQNYRAHASARKRFVIVVVVIAAMGAGGWLLMKQKPLLFSSIRKSLLPASAEISSTQNQYSSQTQTSIKTTDSVLLKFITGTRDNSFSVQKPGWERYVGKSYECRLFRSNGQIKAVQFLAVPKRRTISDAFMHSVFKELSDTNQLVISSSENKNGYLVQRASTKDKKTDMLIYRNKSSGMIHAFVVSLN